MAGLEEAGKRIRAPLLEASCPPGPRSALCSKVTLEAKALECPPFPHVFSSASLRGIPQTLTRDAQECVGREEWRREGRVLGLGAHGSHLHSGAHHYSGVYSLTLIQGHIFWFDVLYIP